MGQYIPYIIDGVLILFLILRFARGYKVGFVRELLSLILNVGFIVLLVIYLNPLRDFLIKYIDIAKLIGEQSNKWVNYLLSLSRYGFVTIIILFAFGLITKLISHFVKKFVQIARDDHPAFASFDRTFGFVFGLINGSLTVIVICYALFQPLFFPQYQETFKKTQFAVSVYDVTEEVLQDVTKKDSEELNSIFVHYLLGDEVSKSENDEFKLKTFAALLKDLPAFVSKPYSLLEATGDKTAVVGTYIMELSALADLTAKVPEDEVLDKRFGELYDTLVELIPENVEVTFGELEYKSMFDEKTGSFYQVGLSQEQIDKLQNICHYQAA